MVIANTRTLGFLLGLVVVGIAFTGGAATADSTTVNELGTQDCPNCHQDTSSTFTDVGVENCRCPIELGAVPFDGVRSGFAASAEA